MSQAYSDINVVRQQLISVGESRGCTLMVRGPRHGSLSGVLYECASLPIHTSGGSMDGNQPLLLLFVQSLDSPTETSCYLTTLISLHVCDILCIW